MSTAVDIQRNFEDNIKTKIKEQMGDLVPPEVLAKLVQEGVQKVFFEKRTEGNGYHSRQIPSWFEEEVGKVYQAEISAFIKKYLADNKEEMIKLLETAIREQGPSMIATFFMGVFADSGTYIGESLRSNLSMVLSNMR